MKKELSGLLVMAMALSGCTNNYQNNGMVLGGITGGLVGSAFGSGDGKAAAVGIGVLTGAFIGSQIGAQMDARDRQLADQAAQQASRANVGEKIVWQNSDNGHYGSARTVKVGTDKDGNNCRMIEQEITIDGKTEKVMLNVCQTKDGSWVVAP